MSSIRTSTEWWNRLRAFRRTGSSWLTLVERWFAELTHIRIRRGVHKSVQVLERDIRTGNADPMPYVWTKTADEILERLASHLNGILIQKTCCFGKLVTALRREGADAVRRGRPWSLPLEDRVLLVAARAAVRGG